MGIETALVGGAVAGGLGGFLKGARGTPDQVSRTQLPNASAQERELQRQALQNFGQAGELATGLEGQIGSAQGVQDLARQQLNQILGGQAFNLTPDELARIQAVRQAMVDQGQADTTQFFNNALQQTQASAARRGVRGQALSQLQGDVTRSAGDQLGQFTRQANLFAGQQALNMPTQRIQAQSPFISQGMSLGDALRQQAMLNRERLANPAELQAMRQLRMAQPSQIQQGQRGSFTDSLIGGLAGGIGGMGAGANLFGGLQNAGAFGLQNPQTQMLREYLFNQGSGQQAGLSPQVQSALGAQGFNRRLG